MYNKENLFYKIYKKTLIFILYLNLIFLQIIKTTKI